MALRLPQLPDKDVLAAKLADYPILNSLLRMMLYERLFRVATVGLVLLVIATGLFIAKIWVVSPKGFIPVIKLSGLDYVQAWSLQRTARKHTAAGNFDEAEYSWRVAVANNPANPELLRGCLASLVHTKDKPKSVPMVIGYTRWLMRLTQTNTADLELSANLYQVFGLDDLTLYSLTPFEKQLNPSMESAYLKALFHRSRFAEFGARWEEVQKRGITLSDPDVTLYHAAYNAGWGLLSDAAEGRKQLEAAKEDPARRVVAHQLQLKVSEHMVQPEAYRKSLEFLSDWRQERLKDQVGYWELLAAVGRKAEALQLIGAHVAPPSSGEETVLLAKAYFDLGQPDKSREVLKRYAPEYSDSESVWLSYSNLVLAQQRWDDLIEVALLIRHEDNPLREGLAGYSYYLEGLAELGRGRRPNAESAFKKIVNARVQNRFWELIIAEKLEMLSFPQISKDILLNLQKDVPANSQFWLLLAKTAFDLKDPDLLVSALASAYKLRPDDLAVMNNYAAALLATRQRSDEALRLTSQLLSVRPQDPGCVINQALALLQNQRLPEVESLLQSIDPAKLIPAHQSSYHFARFGLYMAQQRFDLAKEASEHIDAQYLLPPEIQWMEKARQQMSLPAVGKS